ncbi:hypothetical protein [Frankia sp. AgB32]|uniref:hypothetical protein n=1 Tax=Frankia sp. AgB32 TaxID=631119 RepID=UPI0020106C05|nr:hypothetical protein [Frankia sp. AgB32]MCK9895002.1 hypothetical protein [Frankia sp. AgB32]
MNGRRRSRADRLELADLVCLTGGASADDYADLPIPTDRDIAIVELLRKARRTGGVDQLPELIRPEVESAILRAFALRMASCAAQRADPDLFRLGLLAVAVASLRSADRQADLGVLAPLWHTAGRLGLAPAAEFAAAGCEVPDASNLLADRRARPLDPAGLAEAGYRLSVDADGLRYVRVERPQTPVPPRRRGSARPSPWWSFPPLRRRRPS